MENEKGASDIRRRPIAMLDSIGHHHAGKVYFSSI